MFQYLTMSSVLPEVDYFLPNEVEAMGIAGSESVDEALRVLEAGR